jgi:hypothetical protein
MSLRSGFLNWQLTAVEPFSSRCSVFEVSLRYGHPGIRKRLTDYLLHCETALTCDCHKRFNSGRTYTQIERGRAVINAKSSRGQSGGRSGCNSHSFLWRRARGAGF